MFLKFVFAKITGRYSALTGEKSIEIIFVRETQHFAYFPYGKFGSGKQFLCPTEFLGMDIFQREFVHMLTKNSCKLFGTYTTMGSNFLAGKVGGYIVCNIPEGVFKAYV